MNEYPRATSFLCSQPWAIREATMDTIVEILGMRAAGVQLTEQEVQARLGAAAPRSGSNRQGTVGVLPLQGVIGPKMNMFMAISGGTSIELFMKEFRQLRDDPTVDAILCDVDSPGGSVFGLREAFDEIYASRGAKPSVAMVRYTCASAALFLASAFGKIVSMPSGEIGSIGTLMVHADWSKANETAGVKPTYITYGKYKAEGNPDEPLSDETLAYYKEQAAIWGRDFEAAVAKGRGVSVETVRKDFGQARMLLAKDALKVGLIDDILTFEEVTHKLASKRSSLRAEDETPAMTAEATAVQLTNEQLA